ncbi:MAG: formyltransferase family protein [Planctomycetota bacterium]|jgi:methionyl-tRNA formyltransferase
MNGLRIAFAGDRDIAVWILEFILDQQIRPLALLVPEANKASHDDELVTLCSYLESDQVLRGCRFRQPEGLALLGQLDLDYIIGVHFPYIVPKELLSIPHSGVLNLHPAYLPYNRGWHTPSWAILEETPIGATLHFMDEGIDTGNIVHQERLDVSPGDTANTLYQRLKSLELKVFKEVWPQLVSRSYRRQLQNSTKGSIHKRVELFAEHIQRIDLNGSVGTSDLIKRLRALTTNRIEEAAYYEVDGKRYRIQVFIHEEPVSD